MRGSLWWRGMRRGVILPGGCRADERTVFKRLTHPLAGGSDLLITIWRFRSGMCSILKKTSQIYVEKTCCPQHVFRCTEMRNSSEFLVELHRCRIYLAGFLLDNAIALLMSPITICTRAGHLPASGWVTSPLLLLPSPKTPSPHPQDSSTTHPPYNSTPS